MNPSPPDGSEASTGADPAFAELLAEPRNALRPPPANVAIADVRRAAARFLMAAPGPSIYAVEALAADGPLGEIPMRLYRPSVNPDLPVIMFFHGGGFVFGDLDTHDALCRSLANGAGAAVVAVDYARAPEARFPAPLEDCHAALAWLAGHASSMGLDAARIGLCGDSAGANLAVATAKLARFRGPALRYLALFYPLVDPLSASASAHEFGEGYLITRGFLQWCWEVYTRDHKDGADPLVAVAKADLVGLPPTTVLTGGFDPLRDEGIAFAKALAAAGVPLVERHYPGMIHGFAGLPHLTPVAGIAIADIAGDLAAALHV